MPVSTPSRSLSKRPCISDRMMVHTKLVIATARRKIHTSCSQTLAPGLLSAHSTAGLLQGNTQMIGAAAVACPQLEPAAYSVHRLQWEHEELTVTLQAEWWCQGRHPTARGSGAAQRRS
jgi:hypothetical protein